MARSTKQATPAAGSASTKDLEQNPLDSVRVFNRSRKPYTHEIYKGNKEGYEPAKHTAAPNTFTHVPRFIAEKWCAEYPDDILPGDEALTAIDPKQSALLAEREKSKGLSDELEALKADFEALKAQLAEKSKGE